VVEEYEWLVCIVGHARVDYKRNVAILNKVVQMIGN
jgi:hypothetical protein